MIWDLHKVFRSELKGPCTVYCCLVLTILRKRTLNVQDMSMYIVKEWGFTERPDD